MKNETYLPKLDRLWLKNTRNKLGRRRKTEPLSLNVELVKMEE